MRNFTAESVGRLKNVRRNISAVLLNLPIIPSETSVATLLVLLDHFAENPEEYGDLLKSKFK
jgi:hypothetical protein